MDTQLKNSNQPGSIATWNQVIRVVLGLAIIVASLYLAINKDMELDPQFIIGALITLSGIAAWDPLVAIFRRVKARLSHVDLHSSHKHGHPA